MYWVSPQSHLEKWDYFFHAQSAPKAVRNRKKYFHTNLKEFGKRKCNEPQVLNVGSGPGRDIKEYCTLNPSTKILFECVDLDLNAIQFSKALCKQFSDRITFYCKNVFRFKPNKSYDLIWSAGLFDYLKEKHFKFLLKHLLSLVNENGQLVIGNFSINNPSRDYMELGEWFLIHRDVLTLKKLSLECGVEEKNISIHSEDEGVNLFLHIRK